MNHLSSAQPLDLPIPIVPNLGQPAAAIARGFIERALSLDGIREVYSDAVHRRSIGPFSDNVLDALGVSIDIAEADIARIPLEGGLVVVANHPYGAVEGLALISLLASVRSDVRILANSILHHIPQLHEQLIFVDPFGSRDAARGNIRGIRQAIEWVKQGGVLALFPAGEVSHLNLRRREVRDSAWSGTIARIIRSTSSPVLPLYFEGRNGALFQMMGLIHPRLRTAMLPRELLNKRGHVLGARIGNMIPFDRLRQLGDTTMMGYLRERTYLLGERSTKVAHRRSMATPFTVRREPVAAAAPREIVMGEIDTLPARQLLLEHGPFQVYFATAEQIPHTLTEIGRLREITFRAVGEGSGKELDLDRFDHLYHHLFVRQREDREIVGAYRIGQVDRIVEWFGPDGLYTRTLFRYPSTLLERMGPALELGRSFVQPKYQKSYNPLMLLWKGIGHYVVQHPHCRTLFGPVSISDTYSATSQRIMAAFLKTHTYDNYLGPLVKPRTPFRWGKRERDLDKTIVSLAPNIDDLATLVKEIENDDRGVPVLLRQYLKLGGRLLGLNLDPDFSDVLDALICVDLTQAEHGVLERYMGKEGARKFLGYHFPGGDF